MNEVFADTAGWASFFREQERHHARAVALMTQWQKENRHVVTTNYVLGELIALCERLRVPRWISSLPPGLVSTAPDLFFSLRTPWLPTLPGCSISRRWMLCLNKLLKRRRLTILIGNCFKHHIRTQTNSLRYKYKVPFPKHPL